MGNTKPRILIVDAETERSMELAQALQKRIETEILTAETIPAACLVLETSTPDLIIGNAKLDNGGLTQLYSTRPGISLPPIIMLTDQEEPESESPTAIRTLRLARGSEESLDTLQHAIQETLRSAASAEDRYELLFNSVNDSVTVTSLKSMERPGLFLEVNDAALEISGYSRAELLTMRPTDLWEQATEESITEVGVQLQEKGEARFERIALRKDGQRRAIEAHAKLIKYEGQPAVLTVARDITERKRLDEHVRYQAQVLRHTADAIVATDNKFAITTWNKSAERIYGWSAEEVIGKNVSALLQTRFEQGDREEAVRRLEADSYWEGKVIQACKDGKELYVLSRVAGIYDSNGTRIGVVAANSDITHQVAIQQNLRQAHAQLQEEHRALEEKNITLREVLNQIQEREKQVATQAQANIDKVVMPTLIQLERQVPPAQRESVARIQRDLKRVFSPLVSELERQYSRLSPREISICNMVRAGLSTKEIASDLGTSVETVRSQRKQVRRKLGISGHKINLSSYLASIARDDSTHTEFKD